MATKAVAFSWRRPPSTVNGKRSAWGPASRVKSVTQAFVERFRPPSPHLPSGQSGPKRAALPTCRGSNGSIVHPSGPWGVTSEHVGLFEMACSNHVEAAANRKPPASSPPSLSVWWPFLPDWLCGTRRHSANGFVIRAPVLNTFDAGHWIQ